MDGEQNISSDFQPGPPNEPSRDDVTRIKENEVDDYVVPAPIADTNIGQRLEMTDSDGQRPLDKPILSGSDGQVSTMSVTAVGHDIDLPAKSDRHSLSTYEVGKLFEEAACRVSERTITRWCNKNKNGVRRLDCAFDEEERKYYISEDSVKKVIRQERQKGRQSKLFEADLSGIEDRPETIDRQIEINDGQSRSTADTPVGQNTETSVNGGQNKYKEFGTNMAPHSTTNDDEIKELKKENIELKIELARIEEQRKTKDEMMTFLHQEIDRRGEQVSKDREMYENSVTWLHRQIEDKDSTIKQLSTEVRGLFEVPRETIHPTASLIPSEGIEQAGNSDNEVHEAGAYRTAEQGTVFGKG